MNHFFKKQGIVVAVAAALSSQYVGAGTLVSSYFEEKEDVNQWVMEFDHKSSIPEFDLKENREEGYIKLVLKNTDSEVDTVIKPELGPVLKAETSEDSEEVTVVLNLDTPRYYSLKQSENRLLLEIKDSYDQANKKSKKDEKKVVGNPVLNNIKFKRDSSGNADVEIALTKEAKIVAKKGSKRIRVTLDKVEIPESWLYTLDVSEFSTGVTSLDVKQASSSGIIDINLSEDMNFDVLKHDMGATVKLKAIPKKIVKKSESGISKEKINFSFEDADLRSVLYTFATFTDKNIVISDSVNGFISLNVSNVSADEILDTILRVKNLDKRVDNNIILIAPATELAEHERARLETEKSLDALSPVRTEFIAINYANAKDIAILFEEQKSTESDTAQADGSMIRVDERTNTVIITDTANKIEELRKVVQELDKPIPQVMIESKIVITTTDMAEELGVKWSAERGFLNQDLGFAGNLNQVDNLYQGNVASSLEPMVDLGVAAATTSFALGYLTGDALIGLELSALQSEGVAEVISTPKVITSDKHEAIIEAGTDIPYQEASSSGATSTSFKKAVLSLSATPQITPNNNVILDLDIKQDSVGAIYNGIPSIDTQHIATQVMVREGETLVLGGVYKEEALNQLLKTPLLGDLPILGKLFQQSIDNNSKLEMLVFVTPHVIGSIE